MINNNFNVGSDDVDNYKGFGGDRDRWRDGTDVDDLNGVLGSTNNDVDGTEW